MLLFRLCANVLSVGLVPDVSPFNVPSALLLEPWAVGDTEGMEAAAV